MRPPEKRDYQAFESEFNRIVSAAVLANNRAFMDLCARIRARLRDALAHKRLSQRVIARHLEQITGETWSQPRVGKILTGRVELRVVDVERLAGLAGVSLVELFREPGREFVADLIPSELRFLDALRARPELTPALLQLLGPAPTVKPTRRTIKDRMRLDRST